MIKRNNRIYKAIGLLNLTILLVVSACNRPYQAKQTISQALFLNDSIQEDQTTLQFIAPYKDSLDAKMNQIIGYSAKRMERGTPESLLTNFVSDLILTECQKIADTSNLPVADMALINHKGLRSVLNEGPVTLNSIYQLMPFENEIVLISLNKDQTIEFLNFIASNGGDGIAGATFSISEGQAQNITINNQPLNKESYTIATSDYIAKGGDRYFVFKKGTMTLTNVKLRDMIIDHIRQLQANNLKIDAQLDKRIRL